MQGFKQKCLVLSVSTYTISDSNQSGLTLFYRPEENFDPSEDEQANSRGEYSRGSQPAKVNLGRDMIKKFPIVPGMYELTLKMITRQQKPQITPVDANFLSKVRLQEVGPGEPNSANKAS